MSKLVFLGEPDKKYDASVASEGTNQISINFKSEMPADEVLTTGFNVVNEHNGIPQGDYTAYKYIYRKADKTAKNVQLSNDGSIYVPGPENPEVPTVEPYTQTLAEVIANKKEDFARSCRASIENGVTITVNGVNETFAYSLEGGDQSNIDDIFNTMMATGQGQYYHCDGGPCKYYEPKYVFELYMAQKVNKLRHTTYYNELGQILRDKYAKLEDTIANKAKVAGLVYGTPEEMLYDDYLDNYNTIVNGFKDGVVAAMKARFDAIMNGQMPLAEEAEE